MSRVAIVVLTDSETPEGRGRVLHALYAAKELQDAGQEVKIVFEGAGVTWLSHFHKREDRFTQAFAELFDEVRGAILGASNYAASKRFAAADDAAALGVPLLGSEGGHFSVGTLVQEGYQVITY